jgi:hypothetical protein
VPLADIGRFYSMTSSAMPSSPDERVRPSRLVGLEVDVKLVLVGLWIGCSPQFGGLEGAVNVSCRLAECSTTVCLGSGNVIIAGPPPARFAEQPRRHLQFPLLFSNRKKKSKVCFVGSIYSITLRPTDCQKLIRPQLRSNDGCLFTARLDRNCVHRGSRTALVHAQ